MRRAAHTSARGRAIGDADTPGLFFGRTSGAMLFPSCEGPKNAPFRRTGAYRPGADSSGSRVPYAGGIGTKKAGPGARPSHHIR